MQGLPVRPEVNEWVGDVGRGPAPGARERGETVCVAGFATGARNGKGGWRSGGLDARLRTWDNFSKAYLGRWRQAFEAVLRRGTRMDS